MLVNYYVIIIAQNVYTVFLLNSQLLGRLQTSAFITKLIHAFQSPRNTFMVMEYCVTSLDKLLETNDFTELQSSVYLAELAEGLNAIHKQGIIHRDIKPANILLSLDGHVKVCDLGLAEESGDKQSICGTISYCSPEMINKKPYGPKHDYWAYGCVAYQLMSLNNAHPYCQPWEIKKKDELLNAMRNVIFTNDESANAMDFILKLLAFDPDERFGYSAIRFHPFMERMDFEQIKLLKTPPPIIPAKVNVDFVKLFENLELEVSSDTESVSERHIDGFEFMAENHDQALRARTVAVQYHLLDTGSNDYDIRLQSRIEEWLKGKEAFTGYTAVRDGRIHCFINGCETSLKVPENGFFIFQKHYRCHHEMKEEDVPEPPAKKAKVQ